MSVAIYLALTLIVWALVRHLLSRRKLPGPLPPGPKGWPIIGNLLQLDVLNMHFTLDEWYKKYGEIVYYTIFNKTFVSLNSANAVKEALVRQAENFSYRPNIWVFTHFSDGIPEGFMMTDGQKWREHRRFALHVLRDFGMGRTLLEERIRVEIDDLFEVYERDMVDGKVNIDMVPGLRCAALNVIYNILFQKRFSQDDPAVKQLQEMVRKSSEASQRLFTVEFLPFLRPLAFLFGKKDFDAMSDWLKVTIGREIDEHEESLSSQTEASDYTYAYLMEMERLKKEGKLHDSTMTKNSLLYGMSDVFFAGHETTAITLSWWLAFMVNYPDIQAKMREEIETQIGSTPQWSDRTRLPYCQAVIAETQRHSNIVPTGLFHRANEDTTVLGHAVPNDAWVIVNHWSVMRDEAVFPNAEDFKPERFLTDEGTFTEKIEGFIPFSSGKRQCLGKGMAEMELFLLATSILTRYHISAVKGAMPSLEPEPGFTRAPKNFIVKLTLATE